MLTNWYLRRTFAQFQANPGTDFVIPSVVHLVQLAHVKRIVFSSTQFFYAGDPLVRQYFAVEDQTMATKERVLHLAASLARASEHASIRAVARAAHEAGQPVREVEVDQVSACGITGRLDRTWYILGDEETMQAEGIELGVSIQALARQFEKEGKYTLFLAQRLPKRLLGIFACEYPIRPDVVGIVEEVEKLGVELVVLSSARNSLVREVGKKIGISSVHSELSHKEKQAIIDDLVQQQPATALIAPPNQEKKCACTISLAFPPFWKRLMQQYGKYESAYFGLNYSKNF